MWRFSVITDGVHNEEITFDGYPFEEEPGAMVASANFAKLDPQPMGFGLIYEKFYPGDCCASGVGQQFVTDTFIIFIEHRARSLYIVSPFSAWPCDLPAAQEFDVIEVLD